MRMLPQETGIEYPVRFTVTLAMIAPYGVKVCGGADTVDRLPGVAGAFLAPFQHVSGGIGDVIPMSR